MHDLDISDDPTRTCLHSLAGGIVYHAPAARSTRSGLQSKITKNRGVNKLSMAVNQIPETQFAELKEKLEACIPRSLQVSRTHLNWCTASLHIIFE